MGLWTVVDSAPLLCLVVSLSTPWICVNSSEFRSHRSHGIYEYRPHGIYIRIVRYCKFYYGAGVLYIMRRSAGWPCCLRAEAVARPRQSFGPTDRIAYVISCNFSIRLFHVFVVVLIQICRKNKQTNKQNKNNIYTVYMFLQFHVSFLLLVV